MIAESGSCVPVGGVASAVGGAGHEWRRIAYAVEGGAVLLSVVEQSSVANFVEQSGGHGSCVQRIVVVAGCVGYPVAVGIETAVTVAAVVHGAAATVAGSAFGCVGDGLSECYCWDGGLACWSSCVIHSHGRGNWSCLLRCRLGRDA